MSTGQFPPVGNTVILIGIGGIGCELAARCSNAPARRLLNFDADALAAYPGSEAIPLAAEPENTADMDTDLMHLSAEEAAREIIESGLAPNSIALVLCGVGGQTGAVVAPALANELKAAQCTVAVAALEPMPFEGAGRADMAARAVAELETAADLVIVLPNRPLAELCDPGWPVAQAIAHLKDKTVAALDQLLRALTCTSCVGLAPADLRRSLADAGRGAFGCGTAAPGCGSGDARIEAAIRDACANSFLTQESCQNASAAILHLVSSRDLSLREVHNATELVAQLVGTVPIQVGLTLDRSLGDLIRATLLVTGIRRIQPAVSPDDTPATTHSHDLTFYEGINLDIPAFLRRRAVPQLRY